MDPSSKYSGSLKIRTRMCKGFWSKSGFFGKVLFGKNAKVRIFWTSPVLRKDKSPDFLEKMPFSKNSKLRILHKNSRQTYGRIQTLLRESVKFLNFRKLLWSCDSSFKVGPMLKI